MFKIGARVTALALPLVACGSQGGAADGGTGPDAATTTASIRATATQTRFVTREAMLAASEMQLSGEPLAQAMGRDTHNYSRDRVPSDIYNDTSPVSAGPFIDIPGFSTAVESYEYSKQAMNNLAFESGAGTSLVFAPMIDASGAGGASATASLAARIEHIARASNAFGRFVFAAGTYPSRNAIGNVNPAGTGLPADNPLGWPGLWPTMHVFRSFDPTIAPTGALDLKCAISSDDDPGAGMAIGTALGCADYECDATTLHLADRASQIDATVTPGADGFAAWKYGLWTINYTQVLHDAAESPVSRVHASDLAAVGAMGNMVVGEDASGVATMSGTYLGSSNIEGFQAAMFVTEVDNGAAHWLTHLTTTDGTTLSGFDSLASALAYDYATPLHWFPGAITVTEASDPSGFPHPSYAIASADSHALDLAGMALGYAEFLALTDTANETVGGSATVRAYFDGDPFPADNQRADGEPTLHDRALAMLRVSLVNLDRLHTDPLSGAIVDDVRLTGATPTRGTVASTVTTAYTILGVRTALRALSSQLQLYSNNTPDTATSATPLDALAIHHPSSATLTFSQRMNALVRAEAALLFDHLTDGTGRAWSGWDVSRGAHTDETDVLDAHTAAIRGLFAAFFATGDVRYQTRALAVYDRLARTFYDASADLYTVTPGPATTVEFTPLRFALLQSALRDVYELVAAAPGGELLEPVLEARMGRLNKLVLNGWDDRDHNRLVTWPDECVSVTSGLPRGGLQMGERTLTGELGVLEESLGAGQSPTHTSDREHDCVPEIDDAHLPAALASSITFEVTRAR